MAERIMVRWMRLQNILSTKELNDWLEIVDIALRNSVSFQVAPSDLPGKAMK